MTPILLYFLKLSISLSVVFLFYQFVLRRLTFYNWNRWYLIIYSVLSFFIPFVDISVVLDNNEWSDSSIVQLVPFIENYGAVQTPEVSPILSVTELLQTVLIAGMLCMFVRLLMQLLSFRKMLNKASVIPANGMKLYQVDENIIPFSFGNSIFINKNQHSENELGEIILHEFVHVKQKHSIDIIFSELLCLLNWYNPFAWLIRKAIRQNLEFIADNQVLENGIDRKEYQYLLLKVIGNKHFSIASKFNFSSLKKRIAMMNKMKSAGVHLVKFLFILPMVAVLLLAFRNQYSTQMVKGTRLAKPMDNAVSFVQTATIDTVPSVKTANSKGYFIDVIGVNGECTVVVKDKEGKQVEHVTLNVWKDNERFEEKYGEILPPPPPPPAVPAEPMEPTVAIGTHIPVSAMAPPNKLIPSVCCNTCPEAITAVGMSEVSPHVYALSKVAAEYEISEHLAIIKSKNGLIEKFNLDSPEDKAKFEAKYGKIINNGSGITAIAVSNERNAYGTIAPVVANGTNKSVYNAEITGEEEIIIRITSNSTKDDLEKFKKQMKEKDVELFFDDYVYNAKGKLISISGRMKSASGQSNFSADDFEVLMLALVKKGEKSWFKVNIKNNDEVI